jgi:hypothetical protein
VNPDAAQPEQPDPRDADPGRRPIWAPPAWEPPSGEETDFGQAAWQAAYDDALRRAGFGQPQPGRPSAVPPGYDDTGSYAAHLDTDPQATDDSPAHDSPAHEGTVYDNAAYDSAGYDNGQQAGYAAPPPQAGYDYDWSQAPAPPPPGAATDATQAGYAFTGETRPYPFGGPQHPAYSDRYDDPFRASYQAIPDTGPPPRPAPAARRRRRRHGRGLVAAVAVLVLVLAAGTVAFLKFRPEAPAAVAAAAGQAIGRAPGIAYAGTIGGTTSGPASIGVTRAGSVAGTFTAGGSLVSRVTIGGVSYLNAPQAYWTAPAFGFTQLAAAQSGGHWARAPAGTAGPGFAALTPASLARTLEHPGARPAFSTATLHGRKVTVLAEHGTRYYISTASPSRLVYVTGGRGAAAFALNVTPLTARTSGAVFARLHADVASLQRAVDPEALVSLTQKLGLANCNARSCSVSGPVSISDLGAPSVLFTMLVGFESVPNGTPFANCGTQVTVTSTAAVTPSCSISGPVWTHFVAGHNGKNAFRLYASVLYDTLVNTASDVAALQAELNQQQAAG